MLVPTDGEADGEMLVSADGETLVPTVGEADGETLVPADGEARSEALVRWARVQRGVVADAVMRGKGPGRVRRNTTQNTTQPETQNTNSYI